MVGAFQMVAPGRSREPQWAELVRRAAEGDQAALGELYDETSHLVYGLAWRILGDPIGAEEVSIDVYEQVWRQAAKYDSQRAAPLAWLLMLTRSRAIDHLRITRRRRQREESLDGAVSLPSHTADPEQDSMTAERCRMVQTALAGLKPEQREVIELAYFDGLSQSEIADHLHVPLGTVKTRIRLGMMKLREWLLPLQEGLQS
jgi:RNA polymerase sigma-70 factor (ECF subfamily)